MNKILLGITAASAMFFATTASATLILSVDETTDAATAVVAQDTTITGFVSIATTTDNFSLAAGTGTGTDILLFPKIMDLTVVANATGAGTLEVMLAQTDLSGFDAAGLISKAWGADGPISYDLYVDSSNGTSVNGYFDVANFDLVVSANDGPFDTGLVDFSSYINGDFSLILVANLTASANGDFFSTDTLVVPEPSMLALMSLGLVGLGIAGRRKVSK